MCTYAYAEDNRIQEYDRAEFIENEQEEYEVTSRASDYVAEVIIYADTSNSASSGGSAGNPIGGHCFVSIENISNSDITIGRMEDICSILFIITN